MADCVRRTFYGAPILPPAEPVGAQEYRPVIEVMGITVVDPRVPDDRIEFRDRETRELVAVWGPHGIFQVRPACG